MNITQLEKEIIKINSLLNKEVAMWSLEIAQYFNLAYTQLKIASTLNEFDVEFKGTWKENKLSIK